MGSTERPKNPLIEEAIRLAGGKQEVLAESLGCAQQTVSKLLHNEIPITADWALRIEAATGGRMPAVKLHPPLARLAESAEARS